MSKDKIIGLIWYGVCCTTIAIIGLLAILNAMGWV